MGAIPSPFGEILSQSRWEETFLRIITTNECLNFYDGEIDSNCRLIQPDFRNPEEPFLFIENFPEERVESLIDRETTLLCRAQYYDRGLHHRISFHCVFKTRRTITEMNVIIAQILPPVRRVSNLIVAYPMNGSKVFLEIPVIGAPPEVRFHKHSIGSMNAFSAHDSRLRPKSRNVDGINVQFIDLGDSKLFEQDDKSADTSPDVESEFNDQAASNTAIVVLADKEMRKTFVEVLGEMGMKCLLYADYLDVIPEDFEQSGVYIFDTQQQGHHAHELLQTLITDGVIRSPRFALVGDTEKQAKPEEWGRIGKGVFISKRLSKTMIMRKLESIITSDVPGEVEHRKSFNKSALLVTEDMKIKDKIERLFSEQDYILTVERRAKDCLRFAQYQLPSVVLLDMDVKLFPGLQLLKTFKSFSSTKEIPIIAFSRGGGLEKVQDIYKAGANEFFGIPFDSDKFLNKLQVFMR